MSALIVAGASRGFALRRLVLGSVSRRVAHESSCSVLLVPTDTG